MPKKSPSSADGQATDTEAIAFETAMSELESIVARMESGELSLEASLDAYRRGASLVGQCRQSLASARQQVSVLEADLLKPFMPDADD